ncbi:hypothetical protein BC826DRAFT_1106752 [Russula brevipes]|nr:hypothetical protein BC826DRAFT_1106752 [Russula brevipes]
MHDDFSLPQPCWIALLSIAHRYEFLKVRERAIREIYGPLQKLGPAELSQQDHDHRLLISVAEKYDVPPRNMLPSLTALVAREEQLTEIEVESFTAFTVSRLARAREDFLRKAMDHVSTQNMRSKLNYFMQQKGQVAKSIVCDIWPVQNDSPRPAKPVSMTSDPGLFGLFPASSLISR